MNRRDFLKGVGSAAVVAGIPVTAVSLPATPAAAWGAVQSRLAKDMGLYSTMKLGIARFDAPKLTVAQTVPQGVFVS